METSRSRSPRWSRSVFRRCSRWWPRPPTPPSSRALTMRSRASRRGKSPTPSSSPAAPSLTRLLPAAEATVTGRIWFQGRDVLSLTEDELREIRGRHIAMVFQDPMSSLNPVRTIGIQMEEALRLHLKMSRRQARERSVELLASVGIPSPARHLHAYPHQLSGRRRQRVMIAMALSCEPQIVVADEPTTALDVSIQAQILELLRRITEVHRTSLLMVSHDLSVVAGLADRIAVMYAGEIVESGRTGRVL